MTETAESTPSPALTASISICVCGALSVLLLFYGVETNLAFLALGITIIVCLTLATMRASPVSTLEALLLLLTTGVLLVSQFRSVSPETSFPVSWIIGLSAVAYLLGRSLGQSMQTVWLSLSGLVIGIALFSAWNLIAHQERPGLPLTDYNNYASLLYVVLLPMTDALLSSRRVGSRPLLHWGMLFLIVVFTMLIAATGSRAGLWIAMGGVIVLAILNGHIPERRGAALRALIAAVIGVLLFYGFLDRSDTSLASAETLGSGVAVRTALIEAAWSMRADNPLGGLGLLTFPLLYRQVRGPEDPDTAGLFVHNDYVQLLVETGPLLFVPLAMVLFVVLRTLVMSWQDTRNRETPRVGPGFALALGGLMAHAVVNFVFYTTPLSLLMGFLAALTVTNLRKDRAANANRLPKLLLVPSAVVAVISLGYLWLDVASAAVFKGQPGISWTKHIAESPERQLDFAWRLRALNPDRGTPYFAAAMLSAHRLSTTSEPDGERRTLDAWRKAIHADAWNTHAWWQFREFILATPNVRSALREQEQPDALLARMLSLDPIFVPAIDAVLQGYASHTDATQQQVDFLEAQLGSRMLWLARENKDAAVIYSRFLGTNATTADRRVYWKSTLLEVEAITPLTEKRWIF